MGCIIPGCDSIGNSITEVITNLKYALKVFPNPVIKNTPYTVQINLPDVLQNEDLQLTVINSLGQRVDEFQISNSRSEIHAPREAGIYYLHLSAGSKWISGAKLNAE